MYDGVECRCVDVEGSADGVLWPAAVTGASVCRMCRMCCVCCMCVYFLLLPCGKLAEQQP